METLIHADIFFFIATIWMIVISAVFLYILWNLAYIVRDARYLSKKIREGADVMSEDLSELRTSIRTRREALKQILKYIKSLFSQKRSSKK